MTSLQGEYQHLVSRFQLIQVAKDLAEHIIMGRHYHISPLPGVCAPSMMAYTFLQRFPVIPLHDRRVYADLIYDDPYGGLRSQCGSEKRDRIHRLHYPLIEGRQMALTRRHAAAGQRCHWHWGTGWLWCLLNLDRLVIQALQSGEGKVYHHRQTEQGYQFN